MASYTRQSTFVDGDTITAALFNNEFNQLVSAFNNSTGHKHDGTTGEGPVIGLIGDAGETSPNNKVLIDTSNNHIEFYVEVSSSSVQQLRIQDGAIVPITDNDIDLGTSSLEFKDLFIDGTANIDSLVADTADINGGTVDGAIIGGSSAAAITGTTITGTSFVIGSADISEAELETIDGVTAGTVAASKAVVVDSNKDIGSFRNVTLTGELDAGSLDISGDADIDGTLEADAITVNGATLNEVITDAVGGMVSSNTETGISVSFEDGDNTLDFVLGSSQTTISSLLNTSLVIGRDADNDIDFATDNNIIFRAAGADQIKLQDGALVPVTNNDIDLGTSSLEFKDAFFDGTVTADAFAGPLTGNVTGNVSGTAATVTGAAQSNITSLGTLTTLTVDNVIINGTNIGHTDDTDLMTLADGVLTVAGEVDAVSLDVSGDVDVDGTLEADAITINGVTLAETISDTVGAMVSSNTETGITVSYDDADNTLDFVIGTLNQDTTGNAATATALETARTIHGVSFDGTANIDLSEVIQDTVGAMFSSNTETNITATYQDADGTIDLVASASGMSNFIIEDDDGTEVTIDNGKELKIIGSGITTNFTDTSDGSDSDPFDLTLTIDAAQTGITSLLATDIKIGEDDETKIDFETADEIHFYAANAEQVFVSDGVFGPQTDSDVDLGTTGVRFKDAYVDSITVTGEVDGASLDISGNADIDGTLEADAITVNGTALDEFIQDTVGAMVSSNTESGISVTYQDSDGTLDFSVSGGGVDGISSSADATALTIDSSENLEIESGNIRYKEDKFIYSFKGGTSAQVRSGILFDGTNQSVDFYTAQGERMMIDSSGNVGIGITSPSVPLEVAGNIKVNASNGEGFLLNSSSTTGIFRQNSNDLGFTVGGSERARIGSTGILQVTPNTGVTAIKMQDDGNTHIEMGSEKAMKSGGSASNFAMRNDGGNIHMMTNGQNNRVIVFQNGDVSIGGATGSIINSSSAVGAYFENGTDLAVARSGGAALSVLRQTNDGELIRFKQAGSQEGSINVSGSSVSLQGFTGTHETSGIADDTAIGTVVSTIDELDTYVSGSKSGQTRAEHPKVKVSDSVGDSRVYGVLQSRTEADNKPLIASVGLGTIRVTGACSGGDLLESNGDGTAKVQSDDIIRSKTIGKVTIGNNDAGVKSVSCVLYCG
jgi:cytoskeletal protein CcmA (bactofilin family)